MNILLTGASSGIGKSCALRLDRAGHHIFASVRRQSDAESLVQEASERLVPLILDVTDAASVTDAAALVREALEVANRGGLGGLVNNAGIAVPGPLESIPIETIRQQFEVNVLGQIAVTQAFIPLLRQEGRAGRRATIVNISSIAGRMAAPFMGPYSGSKFALEAMSDSLRVELRPWGVHVVCIEPGAISTPIWEKTLNASRVMLDALPQHAHELYGPVMAFLFERVEPGQGISAENVAKVVEQALSAERPKARYLVGRDARMTLLFSKLPVRLRDWLIAKNLPAYGG